MTRERYRGALLGLAVGDAVGTTVEFRAPGTFEPVTDMVGGGPFRLPVGAWTDDTSMALCLAESLLETGGFDPADQMQRYVRWYRHGHLSSTGECFDIGTGTRDALRRFERTGEALAGAPDSGGNGALMRLAPVVLAFAQDKDEAVRLAGESARTTHGMREAVDANRAFAVLLVRALKGKDPFKKPVSVEPPLCRPIAEVVGGSYRTASPAGKGFVVASLEAALWAVHAASSYEEAVLRAVNLGDDADTTAAIAGQLAGAIHGEDAIPERWREKLVMREHIESTADALLAMAGG